MFWKIYPSTLMSLEPLSVCIMKCRENIIHYYHTKKKTQQHWNREHCLTGRMEQKLERLLRIYPETLNPMHNVLHWNPYFMYCCAKMMLRNVLCKANTTFFLHVGLDLEAKTTEITPTSSTLYCQEEKQNLKILISNDVVLCVLTRRIHNPFGWRL